MTKHSPSNPLNRPLAGALLCLFGVMLTYGIRILPPGAYLDWLPRQGLPLALCAIVVYCGLVVFVTSLADRFDGVHSSAAYAEFGRYFLGVGALAVAFTVALIATRTTEPADLVVGRKLIPTLGIAATLSAVFWYLAHRGEAAKPTLPVARTSARTDAPETRPRLVRGLLAGGLLAIAATLLYQRFSEVSAFQASEERRNEEERAKVPPWTFGIDDFKPGMSVNDLRRTVTAAGFRMYCPRNITAEEKNFPADKAYCWTVVRTAHGIPARLALFWFDESGLSSHRLRFDPGHWDEIARYLDSTGQRLDTDFGIERTSRMPISGWRFADGLVLSMDFDAQTEITVQWMARDLYARRECADRSAAVRHGRQRQPHPIEQWWPGLDCSVLATAP